MPEQKHKCEECDFYETSSWLGGNCNYHLAKWMSLPPESDACSDFVPLKNGDKRRQNMYLRTALYDD